MPCDSLSPSRALCTLGLLLAPVLAQAQQQVSRPSPAVPDLQSDRIVWTVDFMTAKPGALEPYARFLRDNWARNREIALEQQAILGWRMLRSDSAAGPWHFGLLTAYPDSAAWERREEIFQPIIATRRAAEDASQRGTPAVRPSTRDFVDRAVNTVMRRVAGRMAPMRDRPMSVWSADLMTVRAGEEGRYLRFLEANWVRARETVLAEGGIRSYIALATLPGVTPMRVLLLTEYADSASYAKAEDLFAPVLRAQGLTRIDGRGPRDLLSDSEYADVRVAAGR